ncbi:CsiV family protein [Thalassotalea crassostreae]|uniref:CsiV family protein n=1 Tax=Thalassotalea crassostreae TaxID=1763536 RepID=UPI0008380DFC|nr:CsiV family protein [Thalassotalea crassostreae]
MSPAFSQSATTEIAVDAAANEELNEEIKEEEQLRWFEIEVILVEQLMNKSRYNEEFHATTKNQSSKPELQLINSYLYNLVSYQQQLKECPESANKSSSSVTSSSDKLADIDQQLQQLNTDADTDLSAEQSNLLASIQKNLADIEQQLANIQLDCNDQSFDQFDNAIANSFYQVPTVISGHEDIYSNVPYLLNKENLGLSHITNSLKRSKHFKPVLHVAWRQPVLERNKAVPVRLMAGENWPMNEQPETLMLVSKTSQANSEQQLLNEPQLLSEEQKIEQHLMKVIAISEQESFDRTALLTDVRLGEDEKLFAASDVRKDKNEPLQPFTIDGLFNVHLDHYLFINSQFSVQANVTDLNSNKTVSNSDDKSAEKTVLVPFKQNRRVISGEIHYFDHPYMGMIVQIRRHERPVKLDDETQSLDNNNLNL